jgi:hypothetical protein
VKKFFLGMTVLLGVSLVLAGCDNPAAETKYVPSVIHVDKVVEAAANLATAWDDGSTVVEFRASSAATLSAALTVPKGKTLVLRSSVTPAGAGLDIKGTVYVELGGILVAATDTPVTVTDDGVLYVGKGTLSIDAPLSVNNGKTGDDKATVLKTGKVSIAGGTLKYAAGASPSLDDVAAALGYVGSGTLDASTLTTAISVTPKAISDKVTGKVSATKTLTITAGTAEAEGTTALEIPAGLALTAKSDDTLATITGLTVNGTLTAAAGTLAAVTTLTVNGTLNAAKGTLATAGAKITVGGTATLGAVAKVLKDSSVAKGGALTVTSVAFDTENEAKLAVAAGGTVNGVTFPAATNVTAIAATGVTIDSITIPATSTLVIPEDTLTVTGTLEVNGTLAFTSDSSKVILGEGAVLKAGKDAVLSAKSGTVDGSDISLTVGAKASPGTATGFTGVAADGVATLTTAETASDGTGTAHIAGNASFPVIITAKATAAEAVSSTKAATAAAGSIKAGTGTAITLAGASA